jgi:hypothetical protein
LAEYAATQKRKKLIAHGEMKEGEANALEIELR